MRRPAALILASALIASMLGVVSISSASAVPPGDTPDTGSLTVDPVTPEEGGSVKLTANFADGTFDVTFYKKVGDGAWTEIDTDRSNSSGNAYLYDYQVNGAQEIYARITSGSNVGRTEVETITPTPPEVITPTGPVKGSFSTDPATFDEGERITVSANFPNGSFLVKLYKETAPDVWTEVASDQSNSSGNAYFLDYQVNGTQRVFARKSNGERTEVRELAPSPEVTLSIQRDCTGNDCGSTATASGEVNPPQEGQTFRLEYRSGTTWQPIGGPGTVDADGNVQIPLDLTGIGQWTARSYRLASGADVSNTVSFMPGPEELGSNVLRVDVTDGVFPTTKGPEYTGEATLSTNGDVFLDDVELENFGVRGGSTALKPKKPYKLKFDASPKSTGVFGMGADKSWTLLASFKDQTFVRDKVGLDLGRRMGNISWTPDSRYVELFVNDRYEGAYLMTESVKIDGDRVDIDPEKGMIMEVTSGVLNSSLYFRSTTGKIAFTFKDPDEYKSKSDPDYQEGVTPAKLSAIKSRIAAFESKLYKSSTRDQYPSFIDVESAIDYHLIREFAKDTDADFYRSHYFSWDPSGTPGNPLADGKFHFGPAWDFDSGAGNASSSDPAEVYQSSPEGWMMRGTGPTGGHATYRTHWFVQLFKDQDFEDAVEARWEQVRDDFAKVHQSDVAAFDTAIGIGADNDRSRWAHEPKSYASRGPTHADEIEYVTGWYEDRFAWMDEQLSN